MKRGIIGILADTMNHNNRVFSNIEKQYVNARYIQAVDRNGGIPMIIPFVRDKEKIYKMMDICDGFLFPGGEDMDPKQYNENPHADLGEVKPEVDECLVQAAKYGLQLKKPCLGICKGMQLLAVSTGGSLYQDIYAQREEPSFLHCQQGNRDHGIHKVLIDTNSYLYRILGDEVMITNSMHHQSVKNPGHFLSVTARSEDDVVEALESKNGLVIGVQWHPEEMIYTSEKMNLLFEDLVRKSQRQEVLC